MAKQKDSKQEVKKEPESQGQEYQYTKNNFREVVEVLFYGLCLLMFFRVFVFQNFQIPTKSMENTLLIGDHITANMFVFKNAKSIDRTLLPFRDVKRGDVIVFKWPGNEKQDWIKRCIGVPGDRFQLIQDQPLINGEPLAEEYPFFKQVRMLPSGRSDRDPDNRFKPLGFDEDKPGLENAGHRNYITRPMSWFRARTKDTLKTRYLGYKNKNDNPREMAFYEDLIKRLDSGDPEAIPEGFYLMMGDNRNNSDDSRGWGLVPKELVQGRAWLLWWSYGEDEGSHELKGTDLIMSYLRVPITFWTRTHWNRCFHTIK